jgi:hypothetical protein
MSAIRPFQTLASPTLRAIMDDTSPARVRLRQMAAQLDGALVAGEYQRLNDDQRWGLRCLVFAIEDVADQLAEEAQPPPSQPPRRWWRVFG